MIARERLTDPPDPAAPKPKPREPFVRLPREVATHPPIRHRGAKNAVAESNRIPKLADLGLTPFEFVIAATLADLARDQLDAARHTFAFAAGARALKRERRFASKDLAFRVGRTTYQFMLAGKDGYDAGWKAFRVGNESFVVEVSERALFRAAGLARNDRSRAQLPAALRRLTRPVGTVPPLLHGWKRPGRGPFKLRVAGRWMPTRRYARVPWPPPTAGATVLALYLFLAAVDLRGETGISAETLRRRLGIPRAHARRSLDRALDRVDAHLAGLNANGALDRAELPAAFEIVPLRNGRRLRFVVRDDRAEREEEREDAERRARSDEMYRRHEAKRTEAEREEAERRASVRAWLARNRLKEATQ